MTKVWGVRMCVRRCVVTALSKRLPSDVSVARTLSTILPIE